MYQALATVSEPSGEVGQEAPTSATTQGLATQWEGPGGESPWTSRVQQWGLEQGQDLLKAGGGVFVLGECGAGMQKCKNSKNLIGKVLGDPHTSLSSTDGETETQRK